MKAGHRVHIRMLSQEAQQLRIVQHGIGRIAIQVSQSVTEMFIEDPINDVTAVLAQVIMQDDVSYCCSKSMFHIPQALWAGF